MNTLVNDMGTQVAATAVTFTNDTLHITLSDGRMLSVPLPNIPWLHWLWQATPAQRANWSIEPGGFAIYWDDLDDGLEIEHLLMLSPLA